MHFSGSDFEFPSRNSIDGNSRWFTEQSRRFKNIVKKLNKQGRGAHEDTELQELWLESGSDTARHALWPALFDTVGLHCWEELQLPDGVIRKHSLTEQHRIVVFEYVRSEPQPYASATISKVITLPHPTRPLRLVYDV